MLKPKKIMLLMSLALMVSTNSIYASDKNDLDNDKDNYYVYTTTSVHLRENPNKKSKSIKIFKPNTKLICEENNKKLKIKKWLKVEYNNKKGYVYSQYLSKTKPNYVNMSTPSNNSFKSYMSYKCITNKSSDQYIFQRKCHTGEYGIRMYRDRYCIAVGSYYTTQIGTKIDLIMESGVIIKCILADCKADIHTDSKNRQNENVSIAEFVVDTNNLNVMARKMGDISYSNKKFKGEIKYVRVYK